MKISSNVQSLKAYRSLVGNQDEMKKTMDRLSSGLRINKSADDAAGLAISEKMRVRLDSLSMAARNTLDGISLTQTLESGMNEIQNIVQRMRELAVQAANETYTLEDREAIQVEVDALTEEVSRIADTTEFNSKKLLDGSHAPGQNSLYVQLGAGEGEGIHIHIADMRADALGIATSGKGLSLLSSGDAEQAIIRFEQASQRISNDRAQLGAIQNRFEASHSVAGISLESLTAAESRIRDADMAREMMDFARLNIINQSGMAMIAQSNALPQGVLQLLN